MFSALQSSSAGLLIFPAQIGIDAELLRVKKICARDLHILHQIRVNFDLYWALQQIHPCPELLQQQSTILPDLSWFSLTEHQIDHSPTIQCFWLMPTVRLNSLHI